MQLEKELAEALLKDRFRLRRGFKSDLTEKQRQTWQEKLEASKAARQKRLNNQPKLEWNEQLPVTQAREQIKKAILENQVVIIAGETGSGKTTQIPKICLELGLGVDGYIGHTQPRRLAARSIAQRLSDELSSPLGETVGFQIRFTDITQPESRIKVMTDGILLAEMQNDRFLENYDVLIIDEAHERSLNIDFILGYLKRLLPKRPDLKVIITSATLDHHRFAEHFKSPSQPEVPVIEVSGRSYPVEVFYRPYEGTDQESLIHAIDNCLVEIQELEQSQPHKAGDVLVFLATEREIREIHHALRKKDYRHTEFLPLYSRLSAKDQQRIFQTHSGRRVILSTNVAETSLTVPNIRYVIDSGTARLSRYSYKTKVQRLPIEPISQASANQRKGRCGRIMDGVCFRLYSEEDFELRSEYTDPEIHRTNLASVILQMLNLRLGEVEQFPFLDAPDARFLRDGYQLLQELQAISSNQKLTKIGRALAKMPLEPRFGRILIEAERLGCLEPVSIIVSGLSIQDPRERPQEYQQAADNKHQRFRDEESDFMAYLKLWRDFEKQRQDLSQNQLRKWCSQYFLSYQRMREWRDNHHQLKLSFKAQSKRNQNNDTADFIHQAILSGLLTQVVQKTENKGEYLAVRGKKVGLWPGSVRFKKGGSWLVAASMLETQRVYAHTLAEVQPNWLSQQARHLLSYSYSAEDWDSKRGKVIANEQATLLGLVIYSGKSVDYGRVNPAHAREIFIEQCLAPNIIEGFSFVEHNQQVLDALEEIEAKLRRKGELIDEALLEQYFLERLPDSVFDLKTLSELSEQQLTSLTLDKQWFIEQAGILPDDKLFPKKLKLGTVELGLKYHHDPSVVEDGVMVLTPAVTLNQLNPKRLGWLVPGFVEEKVLFLIKALPKATRRQFVPAKDYARAVFDRIIGNIDSSDMSLEQEVAAALKAISGKQVNLDDWQELSFPNHLQMSIAVLSRKGKIIKVSNDLQALQDEFSKQASEFLQKSNHSASFIGKSSKHWVFGDLPQQVQKKHGKVSIASYVTLLDEGHQVTVTLVDNQLEAERKMRLGLRRLYYLVMQKAIKGSQKMLQDYNAFSLRFAQVADAQGLFEKLALAACELTFLSKDLPLIYEEQAFNQRLNSSKSELFANLQKIFESVFQALLFQYELKQLMQGSAQLLEPVVEDIELMFDELLTKDFLLKAQPEALLSYQRYIQGALVRWQRLQGNLKKDQQFMNELDDYHEQLAEALDNKGLLDDSLRRDEFWLLHEYRVQLFAQHLNQTQSSYRKGSVSRKKVEQALKDL